MPELVVETLFVGILYFIGAIIVGAGLRIGWKVIDYMFGW